MKNSPDGQGNKWLIIFLIYADFSTNEDLPMADHMKIMVNSMLGDIITTPLNPSSSRLFVVFNSIKYAGLKPNNAIHDTTLLYQLKRSADGTNNEIACSALIDNSQYYEQDCAEGKWSLQRPRQLADILRRTEWQHDEEIMLATWDHGSEFGIFRQMPAVLQSNDIRRSISENLPLYPFIKEFWDVVAAKHSEEIAKCESLPDLFTTIQAGNRLVKVKNNPETLATINYHLQHKSIFRYHEQENKILFTTTGKEARPAGVTDELDASADVSEILKNSELNEAIRLWLGDNGFKIGVLLMNNCWMMNLHTMYALKDSVSYLVAPEGSIDSPGYNTKDILQYIITTQPQPQDVAEVCIKTLDNPYSKAKSLMLSPGDPDVLDRFKIFAANLGKLTPQGDLVIDAQINQLKTIAQLLITEITSKKQSYPEIRYLLKYIRSVCMDFTGSEAMLIDMVNWIQAVIFSVDRFKGGGERVLPPGMRSPMVQLVNSCSVPKTSVMIKSSIGSRVYLNDEGAGQTELLPVIGLIPSGYGIFFPLVDCSTDPKLRDNVLTDPLLQDFPEWKTLLSLIDPNAGKIFTA